MKKTIMIADDDESMREVYSAIFRDAGFEVLLATNGEEAWNMLTSGQIPNLLFTGIMMPGLTGFELMTKMRGDALLAKIPVIVSSHRGLPEDKAKAEELGAKDFIVRHMTPPGEVLRRANLLLGGHEKFKISFFPDRHDGKSFLKLVESQEGRYCPPSAGEIDLEVEATEEQGVFKIKLGS